MPALTLEPIARDQAPVLQNLFELYAHDFSEYVPLEIKPSGRFELTPSDLWWSRDDHHPFFLRAQGVLCGFALVRRGSRITGANDVMDVAEFFVLRGARRKQVGMSAAHALWRAFPGRWEVRIRHANVPALKFWSRAAESLLGHPVASTSFSADGVDWHLLSVEPGMTARRV